MSLAKVEQDLLKNYILFMAYRLAQWYINEGVSLKSPLIDRPVSVAQAFENGIRNIERILN